MKLLIVILFVIELLTVYANESNFYSLRQSEYKNTTISNKSTRLQSFNFLTKLDHFAIHETEYVVQTYHANLEFGVGAGPVLIYFKDHGDLSNRWIEEGLIYDFARANNGYLFTFNYRFLGDNAILDTASIDNLRLFTIEQILADISDLLFNIEVQHSLFYSYVIVWGSGLGGTLATYARMRYPHAINGVWSADGQFTRTATSLAYYSLIEYDIATAGSVQCSERVGQVFNIIEYLIENNEREYLQERLNSCEPIDTDTPQEIGYLLEQLSQGIAEYLIDNHIQGYQTFCRDLNAIPNDSLNSFLRWYQFVYGPQDCFDFSYANYMERLSTVEWNQPDTLTGERQKLYLECTNTGLFPTSNEFIIFPEVLDNTYYYQKCIDLIGESYSIAQLSYTIDFFTRSFGGITPTTILTIFSNGFFYPWIFSGILQTNNWESYAFVIDFYSKGAALESIRPFDLPSLASAKRGIMTTIERWAALGLEAPSRNQSEVVLPDDLSRKLQYLNNFV